MFHIYWAKTPDESKVHCFNCLWDIFSPSVIVRYLSWESGYLGTHCEIPTILGQVNLLWNKSDRGQNWQGDTKSIVECNDLLFIKVWGGDVFMATIKVEKYFFLYVGLLLLSQVSVSWLQKPHHCILHPKKHKIAKFHENWTIRFLKRPAPRRRYSKKC